MSWIYCGLAQSIGVSALDKIEWAAPRPVLFPLNAVLDVHCVEIPKYGALVTSCEIDAGSSIPTPACPGGFPPNSACPPPLELLDPTAGP
jgi:hypothetical protein